MLLITGNQGEFFGGGPAFDLQFAADCGGFIGGGFAVKQCYGAAFGGPGCAFAGVVEFDSLFKILSVANVEGVVGAAEDLDEEGS